MTILVTGAGGYIGSHAVKRLLKDGHKIIAFDNFSRGFREPLRTLGKYSELEVVAGDLLDKEELAKVFEKYQIDAVMHFAALCSPDESVKNPELYFQNNTQGTLNLLEAMQGASVRKIIFSSTCAVYGGAEYLPIDEHHPTKPENPYGESKLKAEEHIKRFSEAYGLKYAILRYFNVCGADSDGEIGDSRQPSEALMQNAVRGALGLEGFKLTCPEVETPDGTPVRDYIDVEDLVDAHAKALEYLGKGESIVCNLGNGRGWSVREIIDVVSKEFYTEFKVIKGPLRTGEVAESRASIAQAEDVLGWKPRKSLQESIQSLARWYKNKPDGYRS
jgi:UDP-glucose 4-epimerase